MIIGNGSCAVESELKQKIKERKEYLKNVGVSYKENPKLSVIVTSFNQHQNINLLCSSLRDNSDVDEIIICEDGSIDGSLEDWDKLLDHPNDFILRSNDLHEIRSTDRAISFSRGEICCIIQDDDKPRDPSWTSEALEEFERDEKLGVLGGMCGWTNFFDNAVCCTEDFHRPSLKDGKKFSYVDHVNVGPFFIRKKFFEEVGGWDFKISKPGEMGMGFDHEICYRMWDHGFHVGHYYPFNFTNNDKSGSTYIQVGGEDKRNEIGKRQMKFVKELMVTKYTKKKIQEIGMRVNNLNLELKDE